MDKILKWIYFHKITAILLIIAVIFLPVLSIHFLFKFHSNCYWIESEWSAGEILSYFGDVLSFIGTISLGAIAVAQTEKANALNGELLKLEKDKIKPCLDIVSSQLYRIYLEEDMQTTLSTINRQDSMILELLYTNDYRSGIETSSALIELDVTNSGASDIRRLFVKCPSFYLAVSDPFNSTTPKIAFMSGDTSLKVNESKKLYIHIKREISNAEELYNTWYSENLDNLMPHMEFEFKMETTSGAYYSEKITCGTNWDSSMKSISGSATRGIGIIDISVEEI